MDTFATTSSSKKPKGPQYKNFIEAFKDIGKSTVKSFAKDVVAGTAKNAVDIFTKGQPIDNSNPEDNFKFEEYLNQQEQKIRNQERQRFEAIRREEKIIFSREDHQTKVQIENLQVQVKQLASEQVGLMKELDQASFQAVVNPGVYHQNFFERLLHLIKLAKKNIVNSRTWLSLHNYRAKKQTGYWSQFKKSGTSFMLSGERSTATQTG
ncbi:MAG: DUF5660 family protein [Candidatus Beckwithbacteria bacterium]|nr:hypothetical protein [Patescibacteria group bacterium]